MLSALTKVKGIVEASPLLFEDRDKILDLEQEAEERSLMGLGKVINSGVREVLTCDYVYAAVSDMDFDWGCHATLVLKKGDEIVGEEVRDEETIARLSKQTDVWFMHKNFVVYKQKVVFPQDIMRKLCYFETPSLPADWLALRQDEINCDSIIFANPAIPADIYLKEKYFRGLDERGLGTILIGIRP